MWTPDPAPKKTLPVMVWFYGGANERGSTGDPVPFPGTPGIFYDAHVLAGERDLVSPGCLPRPILTGIAITSLIS